MPPINAFCINCNILIKPQSVDAFCTKNFSLMQNASTLPTHFVTKNQNAPIVTLMQKALYQCRIIYTNNQTFSVIKRKMSFMHKEK